MKGVSTFISTDYGYKKLWWWCILGVWKVSFLGDVTIGRMGVT